MEYNIKAIETRYNGIIFRSRLEAKWAAMFDLLEWEWTYEPTDFNGWIPDFAIHGTETIYVEVKPVTDFPQEVADKIDSSGCTDEALIVGMRGPTWSDEHERSFIGWLREKPSCGDEQLGGLSWEHAVMGRWSGSKRIGFCHSDGMYFDRISGGYDGGCWGSNEVTQEEVAMLWREACNRTRWNK